MLPETRVAGIKTGMTETLFKLVTFVVRMLGIPALVVWSAVNLTGLGVATNIHGVPGWTAVIGLSVFNIQFLIKRKRMFNFTAEDAAKKN